MPNSRRLERFVPAADRVVVGDADGVQTNFFGVRYKFRRRKRTVRSGGVSVEINAHLEVRHTRRGVRGLNLESRFFNRLTDQALLFQIAEIPVNDSSSVSFSLSTVTSGFYGASYGSETPVKFGISPEMALAYKPFTSRRVSSSRRTFGIHFDELHAMTFYQSRFSWRIDS